MINRRGFRADFRAQISRLRTLIRRWLGSGRVCGQVSGTALPCGRGDGQLRLLGHHDRAGRDGLRRVRLGCTAAAACGYGTGVGGLPAAAAGTGGLHGFPAVLTSFVGRARALRGVAGLLDQYRLVTITGPGGVGKTRLAGQVAGQVAGRFTDGAWLAELAAVRDPAQVAAVVAAALGIREQPGGPVPAGSADAALPR
jgi:hypothetical protein